MKPNTLDITIGESGGQSVYYTELLTIGAHTCRIRIRSDGYKDQGHAVVERWDGAAWREVYTIHAGMMQTPEGLCSRRPAATADAFTVDRATLIRMAGLVMQ